MASGPSKQDLEMYWQSSRQYFDELAQYYKTADPAYYKEYMEPFYSNPFQSSYNQADGKRSGGGGKIAILIFALLILIGVGGASIFLFMSSDSITEKIENLGSDKKTTENTKTTEKETTGRETIEKEKSEIDKEVEPDDPSELSGEDNFIIGAKYIGEKKYDKAAYHLNRIKPGDKRYKEAQQLLESIKFLKKYDK